MKIDLWKNFFDIVVLPPEDVSKYAVTLSDKLHEYGTPWKLDDNQRRPHLSLHHFPVKDGTSAQEIADAITQLDLAGGSLKLSGISSPRDGAIFLDVEQEKWLIDTAELISSYLWKNNLAVQDELFNQRWELVDITTRMKENILEYGSPMMGKDFLPHFTLGVFDNEDEAKKRATELSFQASMWHVNKLYVVQVGDGFTAGETLAEIRLTKT